MISAIKNYFYSFHLQIWFLHQLSSFFLLFDCFCFYFHWLLYFHFFLLPIDLRLVFLEFSFFHLDRYRTSVGLLEFRYEVIRKLQNNFTFMNDGFESFIGWGLGQDDVVIITLHSMVYTHRVYLCSNVTCVRFIGSSVARKLCGKDFR